MCGSPMVAKCGPRLIHHWAHYGRRQCDPWWENETAWHREWKSEFPEDWREVTHVAIDGEVHRADVKTARGIVIEFQHSSMTDAERESREAFYGNMVWVLDGRSFRQNFDIYHILPHPASEIASDLVWSKASRPMQGAAAGLFFRMSEALLEDPQITKKQLTYGYIHSLHSIKAEVEQAYRGHHQFDWVRPRRTWLDASCPIYIDFGGELLVRLEVYDESELPCIRYIPRRAFLDGARSAQIASEIANPPFRGK